MSLLADEKRDEMVKGLRSLADFLDHKPDVPLPYIVEASKHFTDRDEYDALVAAYGFEPLKGFGGPGYDCARLVFGPLSYRIQTQCGALNAVAERERLVAEREAALAEREAALRLAA